MIITRSPLRISLGGGGTDLPSYYRKHGGFLIAAANRQVRLYHRSSPVCGWFSPKVFPSGGSRHDRGDQAPDLQGSSQAGGRAGTQFGDREHGRYSSRDRARIIGQFYNGVAQGPARVAQKSCSSLWAQEPAFSPGAWVSIQTFSQCQNPTGWENSVYMWLPVIRLASRAVTEQS